MVLEAKIAGEMFEQIRETYHQDSVVYKEPFSGWRSALYRTEVISEDIRSGIAWADFLKRHMSHMRQAFYRWPAQISFFRGCELELYVSTWNTPPWADVSGYQCGLLLRAHQLNLQSSLDAAQAADFVEAEAASETTS